MTHTDAQKELSHALRTLKGDYLMCRDPGVRHPWEVVVDMHVVEMKQEGRRKVPMIGRESVCGRCGTTKSETWMVGANGLEKIGNDYDYPVDYSIPGVPRGVKSSTVIWQEQYRRAMEDVARAEKGERERAER